MTTEERERGGEKREGGREEDGVNELSGRQSRRRPRRPSVDRSGGSERVSVSSVRWMEDVASSGRSNGQSPQRLSLCFLTSITMTRHAFQNSEQFSSESHLIEQMPHVVAEWLYFFG